MASEPSMSADKMKAGQAASPQAVVGSAKTSPIVYGKRPGSALSAPPRKILTTNFNSICTPRLNAAAAAAATPQAYKYDPNALAFPSMNATAPYFNFVKDASGNFIDSNATAFVQLSQPKTP